MKRMEEKLKYGGSAIASQGSYTYGGFADSNSRSQAGFSSVKRQRDLAGVPPENSNTISLP